MPNTAVKERIWDGNILSREGAWYRCGIIQAHVVRRARDGWLRTLTSGAARPWRRAWIVAIYNDDPFRIDSSPLIELIALDKMPDEVRSDAEQLAEWASSYFTNGNTA